MTNAYHFGGIKTDTITSLRVGTVSSVSNTRSKFQEAGADMIATAAGMTIGQVILGYFSLTGTPTITIMYDDDGAGTNEKSVATFAGDMGVTHVYPTVLPIPANKYVTVKCGTDAISLVTIVGVNG